MIWFYHLGGHETVGNQLPRRAPSSSEIERGPRGGVRPPATRPLSPSTTKGRPMSPAGGNTRPVSPKEITPAGKPPRKDVASKIASLWKKVEDSKKQKKDTNGKDKRVWISKGKVQNIQQQPMKGQHNDSTNSGRLIRSGTYEKLTDPNIQDSKLSDTSAEMIDGKTETKQRTRSRLSIKLSSRFGLKKQQKGITSAAETTAEDQMNGNTPTALTTAADDLGNSVEMLTSQSSDNEEISPRSGAENNGSGSQISPPSSPRDESSDTPMGPPYTTAINNKLLSKTTTTHLKRNSSYVSSLGRKNDENEDTDDSNEGHTLSPVHEQQVSTNQQKKSFSKTSSSVVTLV